MTVLGAINAPIRGCNTFGTQTPFLLNYPTDPKLLGQLALGVYHSVAGRVWGIGVHVQRVADHLRARANCGCDLTVSGHPAAGIRRVTS